MPPKWVTFHQKSLDMGPILVKKSLDEGLISQKLQKTCKISRFQVEVEKTLRNESRLAKIAIKKKKKKKIDQRVFFEGEKSLDMGRGFRLWATHPVQK